MPENKKTSFSSLSTLSPDFWKQGHSVHVFKRGAQYAWLCRGLMNPTIIFMPDVRQIKDFLSDAEALGVCAPADFLPEISFSDDETIAKAVNVKRGSIMSNFKNGRINCLLSTPSAVMAPFSISDNDFFIETGKAVNRADFLRWLDINGYKRSDLVWTMGSYAVRGSIIDVFAPTSPLPLRIDFFDDEIDSIRLFVPETQKSSAAVITAEIRSLTADKRLSFSEAFPLNAQVIYFDPTALENSAENSDWLRKNIETEQGVSYNDWLEWSEVQLSLAALPRIRIEFDVAKSDLRSALSEIPSFRGHYRDLEMYCKSMLNNGYSIIVNSQLETNTEWAAKAGLKVVEQSLSRGFADNSEKQLFLSDLELSGLTLSRSGNSEHGAPLEWNNRFEKGQWVVHDDYGVARYEGLSTIKSSNGVSESIVLSFAGEQQLMMPIMQLYKISPWSPAPGEEPTPDSLKSSRWKKSSEKAREAAAKAAHELAEVYAKREMTHGFKFTPNPEMMKTIEGSFGYTETEDQLRAINSVLKDMESSVPMDRLVVGDVGFGKTEVALRAAAEAVFCGKQVALMVPTTLLAKQHYGTFAARFSMLPIRVEMLSRFTPAAKQKEITEAVSEGKADIIIGTHRILSKDVVFKDLGLVIIDEEHRFGVMHKEKMKKLKPGIDVLMLSATPIPRSLSLAVSGLRDMSLLLTPPQRRLPVITVVRSWSDDLVTRVVLREVNRGGQIFFVHNRIKDIEDRAYTLRRMFPKLKIAVAHSKTSESALEKIMSDFESGNLDMLVCTTIIESGLDIPNVNTLIADDAHELGLAQMYQLRGRVGRRAEQAYAFLLYPEDAKLTKTASERLEAIAQLDELGAGYKLAQTDLQIRGGGDIIGIAQHGHNGKVGYHRYCEILSEEIMKLKGLDKKTASAAVSFPVAIPSNYIAEESLRVALYRRVLKINSLSEADELKNEIEDRYGKFPEPVRFLFSLSAVKSMAPFFEIDSIECGSDKTVLRGNDNGKWTQLRPQGMWFVKADSILGPGNYKGIFEIEKTMRKQAENLVK